uniref:Putative Dihydroorotate oxidase B, electron transfer subunit (PyrK) n=1 Tax=Magnetococcus massalia (strain MO-1) TaxID=451514 RepID=A0A1S7LM76_MAGMO|nr:putative Dihydroorotate oxidase B, electron transfer subunit (pyrK) [Candidatus Magnetococcus massalia]
MAQDAARPKLIKHHAQVMFNRCVTPDQYIIRLHAPAIANTSKPGHFVQVDCGPETTLPRPISILDADAQSGTLDLFYKVVGRGTAIMAQWQPGQTVQIMGPIGKIFAAVEAPRQAVLIGGGVGVAPVDFMSRCLKSKGVDCTLFLGMESPSPFELQPAICAMPGIPEEVSLSIAHLQAMGVQSRVAALVKREGWYQGYVTDLAAAYLQTLDEATLKNITLYTCGPTPMMQAVNTLADRFGLMGQASLEEHMACGFGGCAGCVAPIKVDSALRWNYRRVCVDGPVFDLADVRWDLIGKTVLPEEVTACGC